MSVQPPEKKHFVLEVHQEFEKVEEKKVKEERTENDLSFKRAEPAIQKTIATSIEIRKSKQLPSEAAKKIEKFEKDLCQLEYLCLELCKLHSELNPLQDELINLSSDEENEEVIQKRREELEDQVDAFDEPIKEAEKRMKTFIDSLLSENEELEITQEWFSDWWRIYRIESNKQELSLKFIKEQMLNRCVNQLYFLEDTKAILKERKDFIVKTFYREDASSLDLEQVTFELFPHGAETHNRGKVPTKVSFKLGEAELFSIFFKPRDARIDAKVIELFHNLNKLSVEEKSLNVDLPSYKIVNLDHSNQSFSLWEFIEGKQFHGTSASDAIKGFSSSPEEEQRLYNQLLRLESVCKFLNISDLHLENLIFTHLGEDNPQIIPIDLESIQPGSSTGLFENDPETPPFTEEEKKLLEACKKDIGDVPVRFVPISTSQFLGGLTRCDSFIAMANLVNQSIQERDYQLTLSKEELEWLILTDFLHNDVPYLTEFKSRIYYVFAGKFKEIARR